MNGIERCVGFGRRLLVVSGVVALAAGASAPARAQNGTTRVSLGGQLSTRPDVAQNADGRLEVFALGTDYAVYQNWQVAPNGSWSGWRSLGGGFKPARNPVVARNVDGRLEVFVRGADTDNQLWHKWQLTPGGNWSDWKSEAGVLTSDPAVGRNADGRLEVFVRGTDNAMWHKWQLTPGGNWSDWQGLGGSLTSNIAVASNSDGRLEVFVRGSDNAMWHKWELANGGWSDWQSLSGTLNSDPVVSRNADGRLVAFHRGNDNALWVDQQSAPGSSNWTGWQSLGGTLTSKIAAGSNTDGRLEVFVRGSDNALYHKWQTAPNGNWSDWKSEGGPYAGDPAVGRNADGRLAAFIADTNTALWEVVPGGSTSTTTVTIRTRQSSYSTSDNITVDYSGLPGNRQGWIGLASAGMPDAQYMTGYGDYASGNSSDSRTFPALPAGQYEARAWSQGSDGQWALRARSAFTVTATTVSAGRFDGIWSTDLDIGLYIGLVQNGTQVQGYYYASDGKWYPLLSGTVSGGVLRGSWDAGIPWFSGAFSFTLSGDGKGFRAAATGLDGIVTVEFNGQFYQAWSR